MKKILKAPNNLVRRVLSQTSSLSSNEQKSKSKKSNLMSEEEQLATEIKALKVQIENLKAAIRRLQDDAEKKEVAIGNIIREKEKITLELIKQRRSNNNLQKQLEEERQFYYKEKEQYCLEMNQFKRLQQVLSNTTSKEDLISVEQYKREAAKMKQTLNQTLEANYNLSIKFLRMKNTKTCLKTELKTMQLEHEKLVNDYKARIQSISEELNDLIQERLSSPISGSSKKYLHLVKQNSCLVYENLCLQLEVDNLNLKCEKLKMEKTKSETNSRLRYIKHENPKKSPKKSTNKEHKRVRIKEERPEKDMSNAPSTSQNKQVPVDEEIIKIFERNQLPGVPNIKMIGDFVGPTSHNDPPQIPSVQENPNYVQKSLKTITEKPSSKLDLFHVSNSSSRTSSVTHGGSLVRVRSSPEIHRDIH